MSSQKLTDNPLYLSGNQPQNQNQNKVPDNPLYLSRQDYDRKGPGFNGQGINVPNFNNPGMGPQFNPFIGQGPFNPGMNSQSNYQQVGNGFYNPGMDSRFTNQSMGQGSFNAGMNPQFNYQQVGNGFNQGGNNNFGGMNYGNINQFQQNKMNGPYGQNQGVMFNNQRANNFPNNFNINNNNYLDNRQFNKMNFPNQNRF